MIALAVFAIVVVLEIALAAKWNRWYFTFGVPVFWRRVDRNESLESVDLEALAKSAATVAATPLLFRRLAPEHIAFREKAAGGSIHYLPMMRGVIRYTPQESAATLVGLANWWAVAGLLILAIAIGKGALVMLPYAGGALAILYFIQAVRYARVAKALRAPTLSRSSPTPASPPTGPTRSSAHR